MKMVGGRQAFEKNKRMPLEYGVVVMVVWDGHPKLARDSKRPGLFAGHFAGTCRGCSQEFAHTSDGAYKGGIGWKIIGER